MPTYDYKCKECGEKFSVKHSMNDKSKITCPKCNGEASQLMKLGGIAFKGSGFYVNDNKSTCPNANPHSDKCACCQHNH